MPCSTSWSCWPPATAWTSGRPTFPDGDLGPGAVSVRQVRFAGDSEGRVRFGIGVSGRDGFRVVEQGDPTRVAVDVR